MGSTEDGRILYLHPFCARCRNQLKSRHGHNSRISPALQAVVKKMMNGIRGGAKDRAIVCAIDEDDVLDIWLLQDGRCALTGLVIGLARHDTSKISVDRIDSNGNYTRDNVQLVCAAINAMKLDMRQDVFQAWCRAVVRHQMQQEKALLAAVA